MNDYVKYTEAKLDQVVNVGAMCSYVTLYTKKESKFVPIFSFNKSGIDIGATVVMNVDRDSPYVPVVINDFIANYITECNGRFAVEQGQILYAKAVALGCRPINKVVPGNLDSEDKERENKKRMITAAGLAALFIINM